jgi:hypothetical protein
MRPSRSFNLLSFVLRRRTFAPLALLGVAVSLPVIFGLPLQGADDKFPEGPGKAVLMKVCTQCHSVDPIATLQRTREEWKDTIDAMKGYGAEATDEDLGIILDYLVKNFGKQ